MRKYIKPEIELREFKVLEPIAGPTVPTPPGGLSGSIGGGLDIDITNAITSYNVISSPNSNGYTLVSPAPSPTPGA